MTKQDVKDGQGSWCPFSKFIVVPVESSLAEETDFKPHSEMVKEIDSLRTEITELIT